MPIIGCDCAVCQSDDPKDKRLRVSILVQVDGKNIVVDAGPDFRQQLLRTGISHLDAVLLTHEHNDHIIGIDDVRPFYFRQKQDIPFYATERVQEDLKKRFEYIFAEDKYPGVPSLSLNTISKDQPFEIDGIPIIPIEVMHGKLPILGFRFGDFTYITDAKTINDIELEKVKGTKYLVLNALHHDEHHSHLNLKQALEMIKKINPQHTFLTHISHQMGKYAEVEQLLPKNVELAYDMLTLDVRSCAII